MSIDGTDAIGSQAFLALAQASVLLAEKANAAATSGSPADVAAYNDFGLTAFKPALEGVLAACPSK